MYDKFKEIAHSSGATAFGVCNAEDLRTHCHALPLYQTEGLNYGITIG